MNISPIRTKADHHRAVARVSALMTLDPARGTPESDELEVLAQVVELYEKKHFDLGAPAPVDMIVFAMEQRGLTKKDMVAFLGSPSRVSEVLGGKRPLTLPMIRNLHLGLGLPVEALVMGSVRPTAARRRQPTSRKPRPAWPPPAKNRKPKHARASATA